MGNKIEHKHPSWKIWAGSATLIITLSGAAVSFYEKTITYISKVATVQYVDARFDNFYIEILTISISQKQNRVAQIKVLESLDKASKNAIAEREGLEQTIKDFKEKRAGLENRLKKK